jgi:hypothetical protein
LSQKGIEVPFVSSNDLITTFCTVNHWISQSQLPEVLNINWNKKFMHISIPASTQLLVSNYFSWNFWWKCRSVKPRTIPREPRFQPRLMRHTSKA